MGGRREGRSALVTGAGSGIGATAALTLASRGYAITLLDVNAANAEAVHQQIKASGGTSVAQQLDVCDEGGQERAFQAHTRRWGAPAVVILSAGVGDKGMQSLESGPSSSWKKTLNINLTALIHGSSLGIKYMTAGGTVLLLASAGGAFPMPFQPVYAASKAGVLHFARSVGPQLWEKRRIRLVAVCPQFVDTPMVSGLLTLMPEAGQSALAQVGGSLLSTDTVVEAMMKVIDKPAEAPDAILLLNSGVVTPYPIPHRKGKAGIPTSSYPVSGSHERAGSTPAARSHGLLAWVKAPLPNAIRCVQVHTLSEDFRAATHIASSPMPAVDTLPAGCVLIRRLYTGVNASDINFSAGRYFGSPKESEKLLPFTAGFESVGAVVAVGANVRNKLSIGQPVATVTFGGFSDYAVVDSRSVISIPEASPEVVAMLTSGLTASIGLEQAGLMKSGETVLVTAAAGGTGQFAVQLAKLAGNHVIGTCGGPDKAALLARLGVDRVVDYKRESLKEVLKKEYPKGVNVIYESVGGEMFRTCLGALAQGGRLVVIGMISQYGKGWPVSAHPGLCEALLWKSASCRGFFLPHFTKHYRSHLQKLVSMHRSGALHVAIDREFHGLEQVQEAVEYLHSGQSSGKVVVRVAADSPAGGASSKL